MHNRQEMVEFVKDLFRQTAHLKPLHEQIDRKILELMELVEKDIEEAVKIGLPGSPTEARILSYFSLLSAMLRLMRARVGDEGVVQILRLLQIDIVVGPALDEIIDQAKKEVEEEVGDEQNRSADG